VHLIVETTVKNSGQVSLFLYPVGFHQVLRIHFCVIARMYTLYDGVVFVTVCVVSIGPRNRIRRTHCSIPENEVGSVQILGSRTAVFLVASAEDSFHTSPK